jgi:hypothetical protein
MVDLKQRHERRYTQRENGWTACLCGAQAA